MSIHRYQNETRDRALARGLTLRVYSPTPGRFLLLRGKPEFGRLLRNLSKFGELFESKAGNFPFDDRALCETRDGELDKAWLTACGGALARWSKRAHQQIRRRRLPRRAMRQAADEAAEIEFLRARLAAMHDWLRAGTYSPHERFLLPSDDGATLRRLVAVAAASGTIISPWIACLARVVYWMAGAPATARYLAALAPLRSAGDCSQVLQALAEFRHQVVAIAARIELVGGEHSLRNLRAAISRIAEPLRSQLAHHLGTSNRKVPIYCKLLVERCRQLEQAYWRRVDQRIPTALATMAICDGAAVPLPHGLVRHWMEMTDGRELNAGIQFLGQTFGARDYPALLAAFDQLPVLPASNDLEWLRATLGVGIRIADIAWMLETGLQHHSGCSAQEVAITRRCAGALLKREIASNLDEVRTLFTIFDDWNGRAVLRSLVGWIERLPPGALPPRLGSLFYKALVEHCPKLLRLGARSQLVGWLKPPRRPRGHDQLASAGAKLSRMLKSIGYYQRLLGEAISVPKSLRKLLEASARRAGERAYLERKLALCDEFALRARLIRLDAQANDPTREVEREAKTLRAAREVLVVLAVEALRKLSARRAVEMWEQAAGRALPEHCAEYGVEFGVWVHRLNPEGRKLLREMLSAFNLHGGDYKWFLPGNRPWLSEAEAAGLDVDAWLRPLPELVTLDGARVRIAVARDPFEVLLMGTRFQTCLSLDGSNGLSTLANAHDANKQVVYAYDAAGKPIARRLVAIDEAGEFVVYRYYSTLTPYDAAVAAELSRYLGRWARACNLKLADEGVPKSLTGAFWLDAGTSDWSDEARQAWETAPRKCEVEVPATA